MKANPYDEWEFIVTDNYMFMISNDSPGHWKSILPKLTEERFIQIQNILNILKEKEYRHQRKPIPYRVEIDEKICRGTAFQRGIVCTVPSTSELEHPFLHEEIHIAILDRWGILPSFVAEGMTTFIEYSIASYGFASRDYQPMDIKPILDLIGESYVWANKLLTERTFREMSAELPMYLLASDFVSFVIRRQGQFALYSLLDSLSDKTESNQVLTESVIDWLNQCY